MFLVPPDTARCSASPADNWELSFTAHAELRMKLPGTANVDRADFEEPAVIQRILRHLGISSALPSMRPPRAPPLSLDPDDTPP